MSYKKISADRIHTITGPTFEDHVIILDLNGVILDVVRKASLDHTDVCHYKGDLIPGFVNVHCHLELSHMKGLVPTGTGLIPFIDAVVKFRDFPESQILEAMQRADEEMYNSGIMAVGDISNKVDSIPVKTRSKMYYLTFVEFFDLMQPNLTDQIFTQYFKVYQAFPETTRLRKAPVPHAPYSVTPQLFERLAGIQQNGQVISIHNQETAPENQLFITGDGPFCHFYSNLGFSMKHFKPIGRSSIHYAMANMRPELKTLFVHNTLSTRKDIQAALAWNDAVYWATCPNANLYIENRLPDYRAFLETDAKLCIGTDSLTSNWQLSIWEEVKTIMKYQSYVPLEEILKWATLHGALALGFDHSLGSIEKGKAPGLVLLTHNENGEVDYHSEAVRVV